MSSWVGYLNDSGFISPHIPKQSCTMWYLESEFARLPKQQDISIFPLNLLSWPAWGDFQNKPRLGSWGPPGSSIAKCSGWWVPFVRGFTSIVLTTWTSFVKAEGVPSKCWLQTHQPKCYHGHGSSLNNLKHISLCIYLVFLMLESLENNHSGGHFWDGTKRTYSETDKNNENLSVRKDLENITGIIKI